ncbi:MAG: hypothetical protein LBL36_04110 [Clostridiales Family XIII bacterium]|jgi:hypothetical protein|nr:hypothetical protein [Clostridiales Family XIII bacterium]
MNESRDKNRRAEKKQRLARLCAVIAIVFGVTVAAGAPAVTPAVYAADYEYWEDCDWDGYDDHTGVKVPWVGFDGTRGDTPAGPSATSQTGKKKQEEKAPSSSGSSSSASSSSTSGSSSSAGSASSSGSSGTQSSSGNKASAKSGSDANASKNESANTGVSKSATENKSAAATDKGDNKSATDADEPQVDEEAAAQTDSVTEPGDAAIDDSAEIARAGGVIEVAETEGSAFHAGSTVRITGSGFYGNVGDIDIEIHSTPRNLAKVTSSADGSFVVTVSIPEDLEAGAHTIVVLYRGAELARTPIEVGPQPADSFLKAITVGFADTGGEFIAGVVLLASLLAIGVVGLALHAILKRRSNAKQQTEITTESR